MTGLLAALREAPAVAETVDAAGERSELDVTAPAPAQPFVIGGVATKRPVLAVTATEREADGLANALGSLVPTGEVDIFPAWETLPHERLSPRADTVGQRLAVLRRLAHPGDRPLRVVVAPIRALLQPLVAGLAEIQPLVVKAGDTVDLDDVVRQLVALAYERVDLVERRGHFAVRGGIVDIFAPTAEHPVRIEFWGDTVEELRTFAVADQRSLELVEQLWAPPCRELVITDEVRRRARELAREHPALADILDRVGEGVYVEGMEALAPVLAGDMVLLADQLPAGTHVVVCDPERVRARAAELVSTSQEFLEASWAVAAGGGSAPIDLGGAAYRTLADVRTHALEIGVAWWSISPFRADEDDGGLVIDAAPAEHYRGDTERMLGDVRRLVSDGWRVVLTTEGHGPAERLAELLRGGDIGVRLVEDLPDAPERGVAYVTTGCIEHGFVAESLQLAVITETDAAGQRATTKEMRRLPSRRRQTIDPLALKSGDLVVHDQHGVGRFVEMVKRTVNGGEREYLVLEYAKGDRLYVPTDQLDQVTRYSGGEAPTLHRLGGADWQKAKTRARKAVREITHELIRLYSARIASPGHAFGSDTPWQRELEDAFPYHETTDQLAAIDEVKADMERSVPMDRVIAGDVGYGKTEIAVRAAFKAAMDGKQVAVLVPTTLLAQQHFSTFSERFAPFPVNVAMLSRFQSAKEAEEVLTGIANGKIDVVIGTHRLLGNEVRFNDLGLVVVDEEQRFGVEHKEQLKRLRATVDVLTMSATPIPRTLEMSITGIRELSTIDTPPEERHPVLTFVGTYDEKQIVAAIRRELLREGQVFFVHNRVQSIEKVARRIQELVPEARIAVAHGQMNEDALEHVMIDFWERAYDVLVCTTIVESGLDIGNANTLICDRADLLGLGQLHQLRGRVGRGRERAYAYFFYSPERELTENAFERLAAVAQNADLGSGMALAMKDLEMRGAGNLLGGEQSGHIAAVGFDLYVRLVGEAVAEFKGLPEEVPEVKVDLPVDAYLPHDYVPGERLRLEAYKRLADAIDESAVAAVREELADRYGPPPEAVENLLAVASFRARAREAGLREVTVQGNYVRFTPVTLLDSQQMRLNRLYPRSVFKQATSTLLVPRPAAPRIGAQPVRDKELLAWCREFVDSVLGTPQAVSATG